MDEIEVKIIFDGKTTDLEVLRRILTKLREIEPFAPNYWGPHERKREPWDIESILAFVSADKARYSAFLSSSITLWRTSAPRYQGSVNAADQTVNRMSFSLSPGHAAKHVKAIYEATDELVQSVPTIFAYVHPMWRKGPEVEGIAKKDLARYTWGREASEHGIYAKGVLAINARTWFGSLLVERIGRARLLGLEGARESESGVIRIDLLPEPWNASLVDLARRKEEVMDHLRPSGMFMDVEIDDNGDYTKMSPAPQWTPPDWTLRLKRKDAP